MNPVERPLETRRALPSIQGMTHGSDTVLPRGALSPRELEVLSMASLGLRNAEIADRLGLSVHGIKFHLAASYRKLGVTNRTEAVVTYMHMRELGDDSAAAEA